MGRGRITALIGAVAAVACASAPPSVARAGDANPFAERLLAAHNQERERAGVEPLRWSSEMAREAQAWAEHLAAKNTLVHATQEQRRSAGENLLMGTAGAYSAEDMVGSFLAERAIFKRGKFPEVSRTGKWQDVGHYSQIIWRDTKEVGCAVVRNRTNDILVCRYWPGGNWIGVEVG